MIGFAITETANGKYRFYLHKSGKTVFVSNKEFHTRKSAKHAAKHELKIAQNKE